MNIKNLNNMSLEEMKKEADKVVDDMWDTMKDKDIYVPDCISISAKTSDEAERFFYVTLQLAEILETDDFIISTKILKNAGINDFHKMCLEVSRKFALGIHGHYNGQISPYDKIILMCDPETREELCVLARLSKEMKLVLADYDEYAYLRGEEYDI